jgi:hypothetical protein
LGQQAAIIHKIAPQPFRDAKDPLAVGYLFEYLGIKEFTELTSKDGLMSRCHGWQGATEDPFLMTGGAKVPAFAGKWQKVFMLAVITLHSGKTQAEVATVQVFIYDVQYIWTPIPIILLVPIIPGAHQFLEMRFHTPIILVFARDSGCINVSVHNAGRYHMPPSLNRTCVLFKVPYITRKIKNCYNKILTLYSI